MNITSIEKKRIHGGKIRVAAYCRVSTEHEDQEDSLENQISHYEEEIRNNPSYDLTEIYYDFGISGFKESRHGFQGMMEDARKGKIDLIITKSTVEVTVAFVSLSSGLTVLLDFCNFMEYLRKFFRT